MLGHGILGTPSSAPMRNTADRARSVSSALGDPDAQLHVGVPHGLREEGRQKEVHTWFWGRGTVGPWGHQTLVYDGI